MRACAAGAGDPTLKTGLAVLQYTCTADMGDKCLYNSDGDYLIGAVMRDIGVC